MHCYIRHGKRISIKNLIILPAPVYLLHSEKKDRETGKEGDKKAGNTRCDSSGRMGGGLEPNKTTAKGVDFSIFSLYDKVKNCI
jgi:hypothetical protein